MFQMKRELTANAIKLAAILAMLLDHIAWLFLQTQSVPGFLMHLAGRITAPIMCFFVQEGYVHTRNVRRYATRLALFATVSYLPYILFSTGDLPTLDTALNFNVIYTLLLSLAALYVWDKVTPTGLKLFLLFGLCLLATLGDWSYFAILFTLAFYLGRGNFSRQAKTFSFVGALWWLSCIFLYLSAYVGQEMPLSEVLCRIGMQAGVFLCLPLLSLYHGKRGGGKYSGWFFYIFYPLHLLILFAIAWMVNPG